MIMAASEGIVNRTIAGIAGRRDVRGGRTLLAVGANGSQALSDALVQADDGSGHLVYGGDERQTDRGDNQGVLHQILALFVANESEQKLLHG
jgi:hypothetical protein